MTNKEWYSKYITKDNKVLGAMLLVSFLASFLSVVVNHYKHNLAIPALLLTLVYVFYSKIHKEIRKPSHLEAKAGVLALVVLTGWALVLKEPTSEVYLGSETVIVNSKKDVKQISLSNRINRKTHEVILFFNPNCKTCIESIPDIVQELDYDYWKRIAFVDTTQEYGIKLANEYDIEKVPSYSDLDGYTVGRLAYDTEDGVEFFDNEVRRFHGIAS